MSGDETMRVEITAEGEIALTLRADSKLVCALMDATGARALGEALVAAAGQADAIAVDVGAELLGGR